MSVEYNKTPYFESRRKFIGSDEWMPDVAVPQSINNLEFVEKRIQERVTKLETSFLSRRPEEANNDRVKLLFDDMHNAGYWHYLGQIDGYARQDGERLREVDIEQGKKARIWAKSTFTKEELTEIASIAVDSALTGYRSNHGQPGYRRGHSIIYNHLIEKPNTMFGNLVTPALKQRLENGRFWENLPEAYDKKGSKSVVENVLNKQNSNQPGSENIYSQLNLNFFEQGYEIFKRNGGEALLPRIEFNWLPDDQAEKYWNFVKTLDGYSYNKRTEEARLRHNRDYGNVFEKPSQTDEKIAYLILPYFRNIHNPDAQEKRSEYSPVAFHLASTKIEDPIIQTYLEKSDVIRAEFAKDLLMYAQNKDSDYNSRYAAMLLTHTPKPREILANMISLTKLEYSDFWRNNKHQADGLKDVFGYLGLTINDLLDLKDTKLNKKI